MLDYERVDGQFNSKEKVTDIYIDLTSARKLYEPLVRPVIKVNQ